MLSPDALGPVDMARFQAELDMGSGDHTKERATWRDQNLEVILEDH